MKRRSKILLTTVPVFLFLGGAFAAWRTYLATELERQIALIQANGYPVTIAELNAYYSAPARRNAADTYLKAFEANNQMSYSLVEKDGETPIEEIAEETRPLVADYIKSNHNALQLLYEAAAISECRFPVETAENWLFVVDHHKHIREASRLLHFDACLASYDDDSMSAARSLHALIALAESLENEPTVISQINRLGIYQTAADALGYALGRTDLTPLDSIALQDRLALVAIRPGWVRGMAGDRVITLQLTLEPELSIPYVPDAGRISDQLYSGLGGVLDWIMMQPRIHVYQLLFELEITELAMADLARPAYQSEQAWNEIDRKLAIAGPLKKGMAHWTYRTVKSFTWSAARNEAVVASMGTALAVDRYFRQLGTMPAKLAELVPQFLPAVPEDPFDGRPLRYQVEDDSFVVYSIGNDLGDDNGNIDGRLPDQDVGVRVNYRDVDGI